MSDERYADNFIQQNGPTKLSVLREKPFPEATTARKTVLDLAEDDDDRGSGAVIGMMIAGISGAAMGFLIGGHVTFAVVVVLTAAVSSYAGWRIRSGV